MPAHVQQHLVSLHDLEQVSLGFRVGFRVRSMPAHVQQHLVSLHDLEQVSLGFRV